MLRSSGGGGVSSTTIIETVGAPGPTGPQGAPGQSYGSALLSGGAIRYVSGLQFVVSAASYVINGATYTSPETTVTLTTADGTNPRIDVIALTSSSTAVVVTGTAGATPAEASIDPLSQLRLTAILVAVNATTIGVTTTNVYLENTEWTTTTSGGSVVAASTTNPHAGTKDVEYTAAAAGAYANFSNGTAFDLSTRNFLSFYIRNKAAWASQKSVIIQWYNGTQAVGTPVTFKHGAYAFDQNNITTYQSIGIPTSAFGAFGLTTTAVRFTVTGGGSAIGFYLDDIILQGGVTVVTPTDAMRFRDVYSANTQYQLNDVVLYANALYLSLGFNLNVLPTTATTWRYLGGSIPQNSQSANYTTVLSDANKHLLHPASDANARTFTIDSNANVPYPIGTSFTFVNQSSQVLSIAITADTMTLVNTTTTGTRSLAQNGMATALKVSSTGWIVSGVGLT
jgi:hypothetical protein